jgi:hypothetical protein
MLQDEKDWLVDYVLGMKIKKTELIESKRYYYHVCPADIYQKKIRDGIKADNGGFIHLFSIQEIAPYVACKLYPDIQDYALFRIKKEGVVEECEFYDRDDILMYYMFRIKQPLIKPESTKLIDCYKLLNKRPKIYKTKDYSMFKTHDTSYKKKKPTKH